MKNFKLLLGMTFMFLFVLSSCGKEPIITNSPTEGYEYTDSYKQFLEMDAEMSNTTEEQVAIKGEADHCYEELGTDSRMDVCATCNPSLSSITVYNLGTNVRGFSVNSSQNGICTRNQHWHAPAGSVMDWQNGGFCKITFPNGVSGTVTAHLISVYNNSGCLAVSTVNPN